MAPVPVLVVTGPVGVGKTSVVGAVSDRLAISRMPHAAVDMDWLRACYPRPQDDRFHERLGSRNLSRMWAEFRDAGAERLVVADVVTEGGKLARYADAVPGAAITVVRLDASLEVIRSRLRRREGGEALAWSERRAEELLESMRAARLEQLLIETGERSVEEIAAELLVRIGWLAR
jgi:deoxyadenosine/deoxycytidine kinase